MLRSLLTSRTAGLLGGAALCLALALPAQAQNAQGGTPATGLFLSQDWTDGITPWAVSNDGGGGTGWRSANEIGPSGVQDQVLRIRNFDTTTNGTEYFATSNTFDIPQVTGITLSFDRAYAQLDDGMGGTVSETLVIEVSTNGGGAYSTAATLTGADLDTVAPQATSFKPSSAGDWEAETIDLSGFAPTTAEGSTFRIRLSVVSQTGNNLYLDNVQVTTDPAAVLLNGNEGWRMLANPVGATFDAVLGPIWTQGFTGADNAAGSPNVLVYDETVIGAQSAGYNTPSNQTDVWALGTGAFVYVYSDDDNDGSAEGFPKSLTASGTLTTLPFNFPVTYTESIGGGSSDDGWNLLGNPYDRTIAWDSLDATNVDATVYVWNPNGGNVGYRTWNGTTGNLNDGLIPAFQGFFVRANANSPMLTLNANGITTDMGVFSGRQAAVPVIALRADAVVNGLEMYGETFIQIDPAAEADLDQYDAYYLTPIASEYVAMMTQTEASATRLVIDARPIGEDAITFAMDAIAVEQDAPIGTAMTLTWPELRDVPETWTLTLVDNVTNATVDLRQSESYMFTTALGSETPRFSLVVNPSNVVANEPEGTPGAFTLTAAFPNPFREALTVGYTLPEAATVRVTVFDVLGREVATLVNEQVAGPQSTVLSGNDLASGLYLVRVEAEGAAARYETTTRVLRVE